MSMNIAGKGSLPKALSGVPTAGTKSLLGKLGTRAYQWAAGVGFTIAEAIGCSIPQ